MEDEPIDNTMDRVIGKPNLLKIRFKEWIERAILEINTSEKPVLIITNSLNNLIPEIYEFDWLAKILPGKKVILLVDDSHGIGITGQSGEGGVLQDPANTQYRNNCNCFHGKSFGC
ncbi:MAG: hypothetical protein ACYCZO_11365 [Daejeonella sp.]